MFHGCSRLSSPVMNDLLKIFYTSVTAVLPKNLIGRSLQYNPDSQILTLFGKTLDLNNKNVYLVGAGKAVFHMAKETKIILGAKIKTGVVSVPIGITDIGKIDDDDIIKYYEGAENNLPDRKSEDSAIKIKKLASSLKENDILLVLISGGGSALLPLPHHSITLEEKLDIIKKLGNAGADIKELNTVRKRLSSIKGGNLAIEAQPAHVISLILSDIVDDPIDLIASGPTSKNYDDPTRAMDIMKKYNLYNGIREHIQRLLEENNNDKEFPVNNVENYIIGSNKIMIETAISMAEKLNYKPIAISSTVVGEVINISKEYFKLIKLVCDLITKDITLERAKDAIHTINIPDIKTDWIENIFIHERICLIFGGETTVKVKGKGKGGRNQQLALELSKILHENKDCLKSFDITFLSAGTDGIDGPTDAAGAIGNKELVSEAIKDGLNTDKALMENDSYNFFSNFKDGAFHIKIGHTNTNVMDIHLIIISKV